MHWVLKRVEKCQLLRITASVFLIYFSIYNYLLYLILDQTTIYILNTLCSIIFLFLFLHIVTILLTCGKSFKNPNVNIAIAVDVAVQNCIFKNVTEHLRLYKIGSRIPNAMHDWRKQHPQLTITNIGCCALRTDDDCNTVEVPRVPWYWIFNLIFVVFQQMHFVRNHSNGIYLWQLVNFRKKNKNKMKEKENEMSKVQT